MSGGRYGSSSINKTDVELAEIRSELRSQGENIAKLTSKIEVMADSVTSMSVQMQHLVTKESCSEGRSALADDLKNRMDSARDIAGVGVPVKDFVKQLALSKANPSPLPVPYKDRKEHKHETPIPPKPSSKSESETKKSNWNVPTWIGVISGVMAIIASVYGISVFINNTIERQERTDRILLQIQSTLAKNEGDGHQKQAPVKNN